MKRKIMYAVLVHVVTLMFSISAFAQNENFSCSNIPELSDEQQASIDKLRLQHQKAAQQKRAEISEKRARINTLRLADNPDMEQINKTIDEITVVRAELMKEREAHIQAIRSKLNDEQKVWFDSRGNKLKGQRFCAGNGPRNRKYNGNGRGNRWQQRFQDGNNSGNEY